jgi:uncharacterized protein (TIGR03083 family)
VTQLSPAAYRSHVERDTAAYAAVLDLAAADPALLSAPVASCPGWTLRDLTHHLGEVHRWVCGAVREGHGRTTTDDRPVEAASLATWFRAGAADLLEILDGDPVRPVWTFHPPAVLGFWQRRQSLENLVHRWDAEAAVGRPGPVDPALAADGVAEILEVFLPRRLGKGWLDPLPTAITLRSDTGDSWQLGDGPPVATLTARADALLLHLWKRLPAGDPTLSWSGDRDAGERLLAMPLSA